MFKQGRDPINRPLRPWPVALDLPMANQVRYLKNLMLSRPYLTRIPGQDMVLAGQEENNDYVIATRDQQGSYAMIYFPTGKSRDLDLTSLNGSNLNTWWYDPRTGATFRGEALSNSSRVDIAPPSSGKGNDWVLVIDSGDENFPAPGLLGIRD
jgi:hypothetical protein